MVMLHPVSSVPATTRYAVFDQAKLHTTSLQTQARNILILPDMSPSSKDDLKPFDCEFRCLLFHGTADSNHFLDELPQTPSNVMNSWVVRLQAVAIVVGT